VNILFDIGHPKDVNVFKNVIWKLQERGHEIKIVARAKENTKRVLEEYGFEYDVCKYYKSMSGKAVGILMNDLWLYKQVKIFKPDLFVSPGSPYSAHVSRLFKKSHIAFSDTEIAGLVIKLTFPFTDRIYTSRSFYLDLGPKQERFDGYYELAYLHPKYFTPNKEVLKKYQLDGNYIILRLSALSSHHDINATGLNFKTEEELREYINQLKKYGRVVISSETIQWQTIKDHQLRIDPKDLHDLISFSSLCIGEGATMASEAAILGVPSIYVSNTQRGYLNELEEKYGLVYTISDSKLALDKAISLLKKDELRKEWQSKRTKMLEEKIDVVEFIVNVIENTEESS
jgi:predicted glycosyltransferase